MPSAQGPKLLQLSQVPIIEPWIHTTMIICMFHYQATPPLPCGSWKKLPPVFCHENGSRSSWTSQCCWEVSSTTGCWRATPMGPTVSVGVQKNSNIKVGTILAFHNLELKDLKLNCRNFWCFLFITFSEFVEKP